MSANYLVDGQKLDIEGNIYVCKETANISCDGCCMWVEDNSGTCRLPKGLKCEGHVGKGIASVIIEEA